MLTSYPLTMARKIVIENAVLRGSQQERFDQRVAIVYVDDKDEFHVMAPPKATGDALEWVEHFSVRQMGESRQGYNPVTDGRSGPLIKQVVEALEQREVDADIWNWGAHQMPVTMPLRFACEGTSRIVMEKPNSNGKNIVRYVATPASTCARTARLPFADEIYTSLTSTCDRPFAINAGVPILGWKIACKLQRSSSGTMTNCLWKTVRSCGVYCSM